VSGKAVLLLLEIWNEFVNASRQYLGEKGISAYLLIRKNTILKETNL